MTTLHVELDTRSYPIYIDQGLLETSDLISKHIRGTRVCIVSNTVVQPLYLSALKNTLKDFDVDEVILPDGESEKSLSNFDVIMSHLLSSAHGRDSTLIALGGGVIGDITGFAAACYQRGIDFIQIPTTLLSQVDSSVGGKTAVNHPLGKNMIGAFYQPQAVVIDIECLKTLPAREFAAGMAEVIKYGIIYDEVFFAWLESNIQVIKSLQSEAIIYMLKRCCAIKAEVVALDEKEHGIRALLNLGHTFGHAIEAEQGYGNWLHGEAVAAGMVLAAETSYILGLVDHSDVDRIIDLIEAFDLPIAAPADMQYKHFAEHMQLDKKVLKGKLRLVLPTSIGTSALFDDVSESVLRDVIES